jgi:hypothetical protein
MKTSIVATLFSVGMLAISHAQPAADLPYRQIPDYPAAYTPEAVAARMVDGLGFRYYWATEGLRAEDLAFRPSPEARSTDETLDHILGLVDITLNTVQGKTNSRGEDDNPPLDFEAKRKMTLEKLALASDLLKNSGKNLDEMDIVFQNGDNRSEFPFWNLLNGPIADALWHVGQVVSFRRSSGNPYNSKASVFTGKLRD